MIKTKKYTISINKTLLESLQDESKRTNTPIAKIINSVLTERYDPAHQYRLIQLSPRLKNIGAAPTFEDATEYAQTVTNDTGTDTLIIDTKDIKLSENSQTLVYSVFDRYGKETNPIYCEIIDKIIY